MDIYKGLEDLRDVAAYILRLEKMPAGDDSLTSVNAPGDVGAWEDSNDPAPEASSAEPSLLLHEEGPAFGGKFFSITSQQYFRQARGHALSDRCTWTQMHVCGHLLPLLLLQVTMVLCWCRRGVILSR